ncbi:hypothetical protein CSB85_1877 [Pseudomonas aeruginosa]|nr:hypothetical protein CSB85_1877 [Pseudomonas aeruginosa]AWE76879.1 hypothetical protein CSC31_1965 [Pseudomonas aeruginosa]EQL43323.1 hypothetical protein M770_32270 [Pseudomonas aeruginosa VRFPA03]
MEARLDRRSIQSGWIKATPQWVMACPLTVRWMMLAPGRVMSQRLPRGMMRFLKSQE